MSEVKNIPGFRIDVSHFQVGTRVLVAYQVGVIAHEVLDSTWIQYIPVRIDKDKQAKISPDFVRDSNVVLLLTCDGGVQTLKDDVRPAYQVPYTGHQAVVVVSGTLWSHCKFGPIKTVNMQCHLGYVEMRTIATAVLRAGATMEPVCELLGVSRHSLRRMLTKHGMPDLAYWREQSQEWRRELQDFAKSGDRADSESQLDEFNAKIPIFENTDVCSALPFSGSSANDGT